MAMNLYHDPSARLDYVWDWGSWLDIDETIDSFTITVLPTDEMTYQDATTTDSVVTAWVSGGVRGRTYKVTCHIVTSDAREDDRSFNLSVNDR